MSRIDTPALPQAVQERGSLRTLEKGKSQFIGSSSGIYFVNTVRRAFISANTRLSSRLLDTTHPTPEECIVADGEDEQQRTNESSTGASLLPCSFCYGPGIPAGLGRPPQPEVAKQLFMTYFQTWHRFFPFLHGPTILKNMEDLYSSFDQYGAGSEPITPRVPMTLSRTLILQCIFNLASLHDSSQLPVTSEIQKPTDVLSYLPGLAVKGDLVSIQALFAAGLLLVARMSLRAAAVVSGLLSRAVFLAGLHRCPCRYAKLTADDCDIRKRIFWCIYVFDRYLSQALGHPLGIQDSDIDVCPLNGPELHHPQLFPTVPSSHNDVTSPFSGCSANSPSSQFRDIPISSRQSETGSGRAAGEDNSSQKHHRHSSLSFQVQYSRLLGRALELFHKSLHIRSIDSGSILSLQTDINALWNALPSSLQEFDPSSNASTDGNQTQIFNESAHFILLHSQLVLLIHRPRLSLEPSTPEFQSAIQICISEAREIIKIMNKQHKARHALFWPGYLSVTWMAGIVLAFACQLRLYSVEKGKREIAMCLEALLHMSERWKLAKNCHAVLSDLTEAFQDMEHTAKRPAFDILDSTSNSVHPPSVQDPVGRDSPSNQISTNIVSASADEPLGYSFGTFNATGTAIEDDFQSVGDPGRLSNWESGMPDLLAGVTWESLLGEIKQQARLTCLRPTIHRWLLKTGIQHKLALRRPFLSDKSAQLRKAFCDKYHHKDESFWYNGDYTKWLFYSAGERLHRDKVQPRRRPARHSQMFFGAINYDKPSRVIPLKGDPQSERGGITGRRILACLQSYLPGLVKEGETFQHDNARTFKAKIVQEWLLPWARRHGVSLIDWPPYSPDLNPIENI
ncbi:hypothetical protein FOXB_04437 [Fusarium oxysporum f. sp. conglutinans Fo5176]|uniref:Xylanolytic transcriptional activator regulatory domain-containing protein n=1 Tax=Fusarium oxysporum (strain Fo5176) TaxID=660025 RepID=F9FDF9_FUSOF|nr:hypothetical protein FOXB_04437 [Fusarium oxysporum f. sp. conglutinans Fo5176]